MQIGSAQGSPGAEQVMQAAKAMNEVLANAVNKSQEMSGKLIGMSAEAQVGANKEGVDFRA